MIMSRLKRLTIPREQAVAYKGGLRGSNPPAKNSGYVTTRDYIKMHCYIVRKENQFHIKSMF